jgi:outer membrane protein assembly factor BamB
MARSVICLDSNLLIMRVASIDSARSTKESGSAFRKSLNPGRETAKPPLLPLMQPLQGIVPGGRRCRGALVFAYLCPARGDLNYQAVVKDLQLVWKHPMNEGGTNQPAPIVHNGIVFLANTGGIMQAIEGVTGKVIWENHLGGNIAMRGISIYQDKIYIASGNRIIALDARNGKVAWNTKSDKATAIRAARSLLMER